MESVIEGLVLCTLVLSVASFVLTIIMSLETPTYIKSAKTSSKSLQAGMEG